MNLKDLAARFAELHPQYKYDLANHVWVVADPSVPGGYLHPTSERLIGDEVRALAVAMVEAQNADNRAKSKRPHQYLYSDLFSSIRTKCRVRLAHRDIPWDDADQLGRLPGWYGQLDFYRGKAFGCWHTRPGLPWIEVMVHDDKGWRAFACGTSLNGKRPAGVDGVCRLDALRQLLDSAPWLRKGLAGPEVAE